MHTINIWNKLNLCREKIATIFFLVFIISAISANAQRSVDINLPDYEKRKIQYGFFLGSHVSTYSLRYSEEFTSPEMYNLHSIVPANNAGLSIGFHANLHLLQYLDVRQMVKFGFYQQRVIYNYIDEGEHSEFVEPVFVEFPLLLKYKSTRRKNSRMYVIGGINPSFEATGRTDVQEGDPRLLTNRLNLAIEYGVGMDVFFPLFKFSPELRFSHGLVNMLSPTRNIYSQGIDRLTTHSVSFYILFEGGR